MPIVPVALVLAIPLGGALKIESHGVVMLTALGLTVALTFPIAMGVLQGSALLGRRRNAGHSLRAPARLLGLMAIVVSASVEQFRDGVRRHCGWSSGGCPSTRAADTRSSAGPPALGPFLRYLWPVLVGLIGISVLTTVDLLVVKARFAPDVAGEYAAASAFARIAFFLPATILTVLFPVTAARQARGEDTKDILGRSLLVTAAFGALLTLFYGMTGRGLMSTSFGAEFADGGDLLVLFTVSMTSIRS